jgi:serine phosphatase RsbU (regulator of sigma subunit)
MIQLHITPAEGEAFDFDVETETIVIGRSTRCELSIADRFLSRQHARLYADGDEWLIEDLGSRNGTFVNGRRIAGPTVVQSGDVVAMSASLVKVGLGDQVGASGLSSESTSDIVLRKATDVLLRNKTPPPISAEVAAHPLRDYADRLSMINEVHQALARSISLDELLELILDRAFEHLRPEQGAIFLKTEGGVYQRAAGRSVPGLARELVYSESLVDEVAGKGMAALVLDTQSDQRFAFAKSLMDAGVSSLVAAPLLDDEGSVGLIALGSNAAVRRFNDDDLDLLVILASVAAMRIRNVALTEEAAERRRLEHELELARRIQLGLFPEKLPEIDGYLLYGEGSPSRGVSGDYFEVIERAGGRECVLMLADVAGKGMAASLLTSCLEALASSLIEACLPPDEILGGICRPFARRTPSNRFATVFLGVLEPASGGLRYANAGHVPACLVRASGGVEWLESTGLPLGLLEDCSYATEQSALEPGDTLVLYSDGYTEAENLDGQQFGHERLAEICVAHRGEPLEALASALDRAVVDHATEAPSSDDRTIVIVRRVSD